MYIIITAASSPDRLACALFSIARCGRPGWCVVVDSYNQEDFYILDKFRGCFRWVYAHRDVNKDIHNFIRHDRFFVMDGDAIAWTLPTYRQHSEKQPATILYEKHNSAFDLLLREPEADVVEASVYQLPRGIDLGRYGANIHPRLVEYCKREPLLTKDIAGRSRLRLTTREAFLGVSTTNSFVSENAVVLYQR